MTVSRLVHTRGYSHQEIADLAVQLRHTPPRLLGKQLENLERLQVQIETNRDYPYQWVVYTITGHETSTTNRGDDDRRDRVLAPGDERSLMLPGKSLLADLNRLAWEFAQPAEAAGEPVHTLAEVADRVGVSEKTVTRWRRRGLPARPWAFPDGRTRVAVRHSELLTFLRENGDLVARAAGLSRLDYLETQQILKLARECRASLLAETGSLPSVYQVARRVADQVNRAVETIRYTLFRHDENFPEVAIFPEGLSPLSPDELIDIANRRSNGESLESIQKHYRRPLAVLESAVREGRIQSLLREPIKYIDNPEFRDADAEQIIRSEAAMLFADTATSHTTTSHTTTSHTATSHTTTSHTATSHTATSHTATSHTATSHTAHIPAGCEEPSAQCKTACKTNTTPEAELTRETAHPTPPSRKRNLPRVPEKTPPYLAHLYTIPLLTALQERALFRLYNFVKFRAAAEQDWLRVHPPEHPARGEHVNRLLALLNEAGELKNRIIQANLRLVVSVAKNHAGPQTPLFELISDGNISLMRAAEKFDYSRGNRFSTYAVYVISRDFARSLPEEAHWLSQLLPTVSASEMDIQTDSWSATRSGTRSSGLATEQTAGSLESEDELSSAARQLGAALQQLSDKEQSIIRYRFGLTGTDGNSSVPQTLEQLGRQMGVSGERIRQIEKGAIHKLRGLLLRRS